MASYKQLKKEPKKQSNKSDKPIQRQEMENRNSIPAYGKQPVVQMARWKWNMGTGKWRCISGKSNQAPI